MRPRAGRDLPPGPSARSRVTSSVRVEVVVPVRNRRDLLRGLLEALNAQTYTAFDVIVVDDGSDDGSLELAQRAIVCGRPVRVVVGTGRGAVEARCEGVARGAAPYLAFTDSDCAPAPGWLEAGMAALDAGADLVNGLTQPARPVGPRERSVWSGREGLYPTCNIFCRRASYEAAGGFDRDAGNRLGFRVDRRAKGLGFGEDTLFAWRVQRTSGGVVYEPAALVYHHVFPADLRESVGRAVMAAAFPGLVREVPELRRTLLRWKVVLGSPVRLPLYLAASATAVGRRRGAGMALAWWLIWEWRTLARSCGGPARGRASAMPAVLAVDAVTTAALAIGSVRHRAVVL